VLFSYRICDVLSIWSLHSVVTYTTDYIIFNIKKPSLSSCQLCVYIRIVCFPTHKPDPAIYQGCWSSSVDFPRDGLTPSLQQNARHDIELVCLTVTACNKMIRSEIIRCAFARDIYAYTVYWFVYLYANVKKNTLYNSHCFVCNRRRRVDYDL